jgi:hypothetical protein
MDGKRPEVDYNNADTEELARDLTDAIDLASDQNTISWVTAGGKRIAAIVPVDVAEYHDQMISAVTGESPRRTLLTDIMRGLHEIDDECLLCGHARVAHTFDGVQAEPRPVVDCQLCDNGQCRTPAAEHRISVEIAARAGLLRWR